MSLLLRSAWPDEAPALSALCMRSKGHWGYDAGFLEACHDELTVSARQLNATLIVCDCGGRLAGVAQITPLDGDADLSLLFVDPPFMGQGIGRALFDWCVTTAHRMGAARLMIESDPNAVAFYIRQGAREIGEAASVSIPGRSLPLLAKTLR